MAKLSAMCFPLISNAIVFPDELVPVRGQPKWPSDLIGRTMRVPSTSELERHLDMLGANPSFTKHMETFRGSEPMIRMTSQLQSETGLTMSVDELFECAQQTQCQQIWTTADALTGKTVRITTVLSSWNMSETGVGNVCHVDAQRDVAYCHVPADPYKSGLSWLAMGVPVDSPQQEPLPVGIRCHDMGPSSQDAPCHLLSGNEFMAARVENMDTYLASGGVEITNTTTNDIVVSLGWTGSLEQQGAVYGGMCLDVGGGISVNGAPVQMWSCLGNDNQKWTSTLFNPMNRQGALGFSGDCQGDKRGAGNVFPRVTHCLAVPGGNLEAGQAVWIWECDGSDFQDWQWTTEYVPDPACPTCPGPHLTSNGRQHLSLTAYPSWCLERPSISTFAGGQLRQMGDGGHPFIAPCSDSELQLWLFPQTSHNSQCSLPLLV